MAMVLDPISDGLKKIAQGVLINKHPPSRLADIVTGFVRRDADLGPQIVRILPEVRFSIQIMLNWTHWLRALIKLRKLF
jgi:hypothetical protein